MDNQQLEKTILQLQQEVKKLKQTSDLNYNLYNNMIKHNAYIYNQISTVSGKWDNNYKIEYLFDKVPNNSLLFMVPYFSSQSNSKNKIKLTLRYLDGYKEINGKLKVHYSESEYKVYVESQSGLLKEADENDIVANRLAIFRFINRDSDTVILLNSPLYNTISVSSLVVTQNAIFKSTPKVIKNGMEIPLLDNDDFSLLEARVDQLESKIQFGDQSPEEAMVDMPIGSIYIQVEKGY